MLRSAVVAGIALALSATAIALQMLEERGDLQALLRPALLRGAPVPGPLDRADPGPAAAPGVGRGGPRAGASLDTLIGISTALAAIAAVVLVGRYGLNPFFRSSPRAAPAR